MPKIHSFKGIRPNPAIVEQVVLYLEDMSVAEAKIIRKENPYSYVNMLVPKLENRFMRASREELAYKKIQENFEEFIEKGILIKDEIPAIYIYQIRHRNIIQTGIWTATSIDDYLNNTLKKHELTQAERERGLINYLQKTGVDANPVLITYTPVKAINNVINNTIFNEPQLNFTKRSAIHKLWKIDSSDIINMLVKEFEKLPVAYIADGHHRAAAAATFGVERRKLNFKHSGAEEYNFFSTVYMATDQLRILGFHRMIKDLGSLSKEQFFKRIKEHFLVEIVSNTVLFKPESPHQFGMYLNKVAYKLTAKPHTYRHDNPVSQLDVSILQDYILLPILNIADPRIDDRLNVIGGITEFEELIKKVDDGIFAVAFILYPTSMDQLFRVANAGEVMPPKSTWFEPKFLSGLIIHQVD